MSSPFADIQPAQFTNFGATESSAASAGVAAVAKVTRDDYAARKGDPRSWKAAVPQPCVICKSITCTGHGPQVDKKSRSAALQSLHANTPFGRSQLTKKAQDALQSENLERKRIQTEAKKHHDGLLRLFEWHTFISEFASEESQARQQVQELHLATLRKLSLSMHSAGLATNLIRTHREGCMAAVSAHFTLIERLKQRESIDRSLLALVAHEATQRQHISCGQDSDFSNLMQWFAEFKRGTMQNVLKLKKLSEAQSISRSMIQTEEVERITALYRIFKKHENVIREHMRQRVAFDESYNTMFREFCRQELKTRNTIVEACRAGAEGIQGMQQRHHSERVAHMREVEHFACALWNQRMQVVQEVGGLWEASLREVHATTTRKRKAVADMHNEAVQGAHALWVEFMESMKTLYCNMDYEKTQRRLWVEDKAAQRCNALQLASDGLSAIFVAALDELHAMKAAMIDGESDVTRVMETKAAYRNELMAIYLGQRTRIADEEFSTRENIGALMRRDAGVVQEVVEQKRTALLEFSTAAIAGLAAVCDEEWSDRNAVYDKMAADEQRVKDRMALMANTKATFVRDVLLWREEFAATEEKHWCLLMGKEEDDQLAVVYSVQRRECNHLATSESTARYQLECYQQRETSLIIKQLNDAIEGASERQRAMFYEAETTDRSYIEEDFVAGFAEFRSLEAEQLEIVKVVVAERLYQEKLAREVALEEDERYYDDDDEVIEGRKSFVNFRRSVRNTVSFVNDGDAFSRRDSSGLVDDDDDFGNDHAVRMAYCRSVVSAHPDMDVTPAMSQLLVALLDDVEGQLHETEAHFKDLEKRESMIDRELQRVRPQINHHLKVEDTLEKRVTTKQQEIKNVAVQSKDRKKQEQQRIRKLHEKHQASIKAKRDMAEHVEKRKDEIRDNLRRK